MQNLIDRFLQASLGIRLYFCDTLINVMPSNLRVLHPIKLGFEQRQTSSSQIFCGFNQSFPSKARAKRVLQLLLAS